MSSGTSASGSVRRAWAASRRRPASHTSTASPAHPRSPRVCQASTTPGRTSPPRVSKRRGEGRPPPRNPLQRHPRLEYLFWSGSHLPAALLAASRVLGTDHPLHDPAVVKDRLAHALGLVLRRIAEPVCVLDFPRQVALGQRVAALAQH